MAAADFAVTVDFGWLAGMVNIAQACEYLGDEQRAAMLYPRLAPVAEQVGMVTVAVLCYSSLGYAAGLLASCLRRREDAERHFQHAITVNEAIGARPYLVRARRAYAAMLLGGEGPLRDEDRRRAAELATAALNDAEQLGMASELERLQRLQARLAS